MAARGAKSVLWRTQGWINGSWRAARSGNTYPVYSPSSGGVLAEIPDMGPEDALEAVHVAHQAQKLWAAATAKERSVVLRRWNDLILQNERELAEIVSHEAGKPLTDSLTEIRYAASFLEWFSEEAKRINGSILPAPVRGRRVLVLKQPVGVAALITPWNFPVAMVTRKVGPALAAGCSAVLKPSEETPMSALALAKLSEEAGVPTGVLNVLPASRGSTPSLVSALTSSQLVTKLSFTGSTTVGKVLMAQSADTVKKLSLELGGNAPLIVFNSADINQAVLGTMAAKFRNTGQTCIAPNRILVQSGVHDHYVEALSMAVARLKQGHPFSEGTNQGCLITTAARDKPVAHPQVEAMVNDARERGAHVEVGGAVNESLGPLFYAPTVITNTTPDMRLSQEELFGPVASVMRFESEEEAVAIANATPYGLAAYFFSNDAGQIWRVGESLEAGIVGVNEGAVSSEMVPFGGIKQSGLGREGSVFGIEEYLELKYLNINL